MAKAKIFPSYCLGTLNGLHTNNIFVQGKRFIKKKVLLSNVKLCINSISCVGHQMKLITACHTNHTRLMCKLKSLNQIHLVHTCN